MIIAISVKDRLNIITRGLDRVRLYAINKTRKETE